MQKEIVVVGSINLDLVASSSHIPRAGETVAGSTFRTFPAEKAESGRRGRAIGRCGHHSRKTRQRRIRR